MYLIYQVANLKQLFKFTYCSASTPEEDDFFIFVSFFAAVYQCNVQGVIPISIR